MDSDSSAADRAASFQREHKAAFFRHSGWLMIAGITAGFFTWGVHFLSKKVPDTEWGLFWALLAVLMFIPGAPLQMVFAQQTAAALATGRERQLRGMIRLTWLGTTLLCVLGGIALLAGGQQYLVTRWEMSSAGPLWAALAGILLSFWMPMFSGVMQGQQNFFWLGNSQIVNGVVRLLAAGGIVLAVRGEAGGLMLGVVIGLATATGVAMWQTRRLWYGPGGAFDWQSLLRQVMPLMIGFAAFQFLFSADAVFVKSYFPKQEVSYYGAAGTLSRALLWFVGPLSAVMFPKIVHSVARSEKTDLLGLTLVCTAVLAAIGAAGLWLLGPWFVRIVYTPAYVPIATAVLPWYAAAILPYCVTNVLVNNLLARSDFRIVPVMVALAVGYGVTITFFHSSLILILQILGLFNVSLLLISVWFTRRMRGTVEMPPTADSRVNA